MKTFLSILLLSIIPHDSTLHDSAELVELNHGYDENGKWIWDQVIWWDWNKELNDYVVVDHRCLIHVDAFPRRDWRNGGYYSMYTERFTHDIRMVRAKLFKESWCLATDDPEKLNKEVWPPCRRRMLQPARNKPEPGRPVE